MNAIEVSQLNTLVAVKKWASFSKAAQEIGVTQSAISQSIKSLESKMGVVLFKRSGKEVIPTQEGKKLCEMAKKVILTMEETIKDVSNKRDTMVGKLRVGTLSGIGKSWVTNQLIEFSKKYPEVSLYVQLDFHSNLLKDFEQFYLDFLILPEDDLPLHGEKLPFCEEYINLVFPKDNNFGIHEKISLKELQKIPLICFEHDDTLFQQWCRKHFGNIPKDIKRRFVVNSHGNILAAVSEGMGMAVVPTHVLERSFYRDKVGTLGKSFEVHNNLFFIVYHPESRNLLRNKTLIKNLLERVKD